jgi:hypothetical protein
VRANPQIQPGDIRDKNFTPLVFRTHLLTCVDTDTVLIVSSPHKKMLLFSACAQADGRSSERGRVAGKLAWDLNFTESTQDSWGCEFGRSPQQ